MPYVLSLNTSLHTVRSRSSLSMLGSTGASSAPLSLSLAKASRTKRSKAGRGFLGAGLGALGLGAAVAACLNFSFAGPTVAITSLLLGLTLGFSTPGFSTPGLAAVGAAALVAVVGFAVLFTGGSRGEGAALDGPAGPDLSGAGLEPTAPAGFFSPALAAALRAARSLYSRCLAGARSSQSS